MFCVLPVSDKNTDSENNARRFSDGSHASVSAQIMPVFSTVSFGLHKRLHAAPSATHACAPTGCRYNGAVVSQWRTIVVGP